MFIRFTLAWLIILVVATYDNYLTVKHGPVIGEMEYNPVGRYVMGSEGGVPLFVGLKTAGVGLSLLFAFVLWQRERLRASVLRATYVVAMLQVGLFGFLETDWVRIQMRAILEESELQAQWARERNALLPIANPVEASNAEQQGAPPSGVFQAGTLTQTVLTLEVSSSGRDELAVRDNGDGITPYSDATTDASPVVLD